MPFASYRQPGAETEPTTVTDRMSGQAAGECCCGGGDGGGPCNRCSFVICLCNSNMVSDDDFYLYLNGELIAYLPEVDTACSAGGVCRGNVVAPTGATHVVNQFSCQCCTPGINSPIQY